MFDWIIVGCGFTGSVLARVIAEGSGESVLILDARNHIAGNAYDYYNEDGILIHRYGPHIFHTNGEWVWKFLSRFTQWRHYQHRVLGVIDGTEVPIPFNLNSLYELFSPRMAAEFEEELVKEFGFNKKVPILKLRESGSTQLRFLAEYIYKNVYQNYSKKQWGMSPEELSPAVTARVPVYISRDDRYFQDKYQAMPLHGYTRMFENILDHKKIKVLLNADFAEVANVFNGAKLIYTGPVDEYFSFKYGELPYRSIRFEYRTLNYSLHQKVGTVNYPNEYDFTRVTEQRILTGQKHDKTTLVYEYPQPYTRGENAPYYPIPSEDTQTLYRKYRTKVEALRGRVWFAGRLGEYKYYNMDQAVARALSLYKNELS